GDELASAGVERHRRAAEVDVLDRRRVLPMIEDLEAARIEREEGLRVRRGARWTFAVAGGDVEPIIVLHDGDAAPDRRALLAGIDQRLRLHGPRRQIDGDDAAADLAREPCRRPDADVEASQPGGDGRRRLDELAAGSGGWIRHAGLPDRAAVRGPERVDVAVGRGDVDDSVHDRRGCPEAGLLGTLAVGDDRRVQLARPERFAALRLVECHHLAAEGGGVDDDASGSDRLRVHVLPEIDPAAHGPEIGEIGDLGGLEDAGVLGSAESALAVLPPIATAGWTGVDRSGIRWRPAVAAPARRRHGAARSARAARAAAARERTKHDAEQR